MFRDVAYHDLDSPNSLAVELAPKTPNFDGGDRKPGPILKNKHVASWR